MTAEWWPLSENSEGRLPASDIDLEMAGRLWSWMRIFLAGGDIDA
jgi:hypothetical protein